MLTRPLVAAALVAAALTAVPAQAADSGSVLGLVCGNDRAATQCDPFWLFRPCGPLVDCP